jgi:hypothetical protein
MESITTNNSTILCGYDHCSTKYGHLGEDALHTGMYVDCIKSSLEPWSFPPRIDKSTPLQHAHLPPVRPRASCLRPLLIAHLLISLEHRNHFFTLRSTCLLCLFDSPSWSSALLPLAFQNFYYGALDSALWLLCSSPLH